jgi:hypothetical protein
VIEVYLEVMEPGLRRGDLAIPVIKSSRQDKGVDISFKYMFLAAKIIRTASYVVMMLSENHPNKDVYERCLS